MITYWHEKKMFGMERSMGIIKLIPSARTLQCSKMAYYGMMNEFLVAGIIFIMIILICIFYFKSTWFFFA